MLLFGAVVAGLAKKETAHSVESKEEMDVGLGSSCAGGGCFIHFSSRDVAET